jgi:hypothetical protein
MVYGICPPLARQGLKRKSRRICTGKAEELERKARFFCGAKKGAEENKGEFMSDKDEKPAPPPEEERGTEISYGVAEPEKEERIEFCTERPNIFKAIDSENISKKP